MRTGQKRSDAMREGPFPLLPEHVRFLEWSSEPSRFNIGVLLDLDVDVTEDALRRAVMLLWRHHSSLRLRIRDGREPTGDFLPISDVRVPLRVHELDDAELPAFLESAQASFDLSTGPLIRFDLINLAHAGRRLLVLAHHLVTDALGFRILIQDLASAVRGYGRNVEVELAPYTSISELADALVDYANSNEGAVECREWLEEAAIDVDGVGRDRVGRNTMASTQTLVTFQPSDVTAGLQRSALPTRLAEGLLCGWARAIASRTDGGTLRLSMIHHGRARVLDGVQLGRAVGWLSATYPIIVETRGEDLRVDLGAVQRSMRAVAGRATRYGAIRYYRRGDDADALRRTPHPDLLFNFIGEIDRGLGDGPFHLAVESVGRTDSPVGDRPHLLGIGTEILGGVLRATWYYSNEIHDEATVLQLAGAFDRAVLDVVGLTIKGGSPDAASCR